MQLIPPFAEYFTVAEALELPVSAETRGELEPLAKDEVLLAVWIRFSDEAQRDLINAHDQEYYYESWPRGDREAREQSATQVRP